MTRVVAVVQHLRPGGIETLVLELLRLAPPDQSVQILSLEGQLDSARAQWPRLAAFDGSLGFLDKAPGWRPEIIQALRRRLRQGRVDAVHTHHIGPLIYGALAARLAGVRRLGPYRT